MGPSYKCTLRRGCGSYVFDDLSFKQAEDMLRLHGENGTYLVSHFHDPESFAVSVRLRYSSVLGGLRSLCIAYVEPVGKGKRWCTSTIPWGLPASNFMQMVS